MLCAAGIVEASFQKESTSHFLQHRSFPGFNKRATTAATILCFYCANKNTRKLLNQVPDADPHLYIHMHIHTYLFVYIYLCVYIDTANDSRPFLRPCGSAVFICNRKQKQSTANFVDAFSLL